MERNDNLNNVNGVMTLNEENTQSNITNNHIDEPITARDINPILNDTSSTNDSAMNNSNISMNGNNTPVNNSVPSVNINTEQNLGNNVPTNKNSNSNNVLLIIIGILLVAVIGAIVFYFITNNKNNDNNNNDNKENNEPNIQENNKIEEIVWNGVYKNENGIIRLYQLDNETINFEMEIDGSFISGNADINGNSAEGDIFETYTFTLNGEKLEFSTSDKDLTTGIYAKTGDYTIEDYYTTNYGDPSYLTNGLNGIFKNEQLTIKIFQTSDDKARIYITKGFSSYSGNVDIVNGEMVYEDESFENIEKINASITDDTLVISASSTDTDSILNEVSGTYTKTNSYTMEDIIKNEF